MIDCQTKYVPFKGDIKIYNFRKEKNNGKCLTNQKKGLYLRFRLVIERGG